MMQISQNFALCTNPNHIYYSGKTPADSLFVRASRNGWVIQVNSMVVDVDTEEMLWRRLLDLKHDFVMNPSPEDSVSRHALSRRARLVLENGPSYVEAAQEDVYALLRKVFIEVAHSLGVPSPRLSARGFASKKNLQTPTISGKFSCHTTGQVVKATLAALPDPLSDNGWDFHFRIDSRNPAQLLSNREQLAHGLQNAYAKYDLAQVNAFQGNNFNWF